MRPSSALGIVLAVGCATPAATTGPSPALPPARVTADSTASTLVPVNLGSLRQDDIAIVLQPTGVRVSALPLDESIIRTLAPDSYRSLRGIVESKRLPISQRGQVRGQRDPRVWYLSFYGLTPNARFIPTDITVSSGGRDYHPFDVIPISDGFGSQRVNPRETQSGLLLFDEAVDPNQPLVVSMGTERNTQWSNEGTLKLIEAERNRIRARAAATNP